MTVSEMAVSQLWLKINRYENYDPQLLERKIEAFNRVTGGFEGYSTGYKCLTMDDM